MKGATSNKEWEDQIDKAKKLAEKTRPDLSNKVPLKIDRSTIIYVDPKKLETLGKDHFINKYENRNKNITS